MYLPALARWPFLYGIGRFDRRREYLRDVAVASNQIFVEVPFRDVMGARLGSPFVEGVPLGPITTALAAIGKVTAY